MRTFQAIGRWWRRRKRKIDHDVLFFEMSRQARTGEQFRTAMRAHMLLDPAWGKEHVVEFTERDRTAWHTAFGYWP